MLQIGGFSQELFKDSALVLIALFIFCVGSQMNLKIGGKALKKGMLLTTTKYFSGLAVGLLLGLLFDPWNGLFGLSTIAIIAAMTNSNSGMYAALTSTYGNRSDVGGLSILAINDGPLLTLISLGFIGTTFPIISFISVLLPLSIGMILGNLDPKISEFLRPGETILIPFFAFSLGAGMNLAEFFNFSVLSGELTLALLTFICTAFTGVIAFKLFKEKSVIAPISESSTAGNAVSTPAAVVAAASTALANGNLSQNEFAMIEKIAPLATAQISISAITTAILCPIAVIMVDKYQKNKGVYGTNEYFTHKSSINANEQRSSRVYVSASYKEDE